MTYYQQRKARGLTPAVCQQLKGIAGECPVGQVVREAIELYVADVTR